MTKFLRWVLATIVLVGLAGCQTPGKTGCPTACKQDAKACTYCAKSQMLTGHEGTVHCDKCNQDLPAGKYCAKCNRFMLAGTVKCCGQEFPKGAYCEKCKKYVGVEGVAYCEKCKAPYNKSSGCPTCKK